MQIERIVAIERVHDARHFGGLAHESRLARRDRLFRVRGDGNEEERARHSARHSEPQHERELTSPRAHEQIPPTSANECQTHAFRSTLRQLALWGKR